MGRKSHEQVFTDAYFLDKAEQMAALGADMITIKDMSASKTLIHMPHTPLSPIAQEHNTKPVILCYYTIFPGRLVEDAGKKGRPPCAAGGMRGASAQPITV